MAFIRICADGRIQRFAPDGQRAYAGRNAAGADDRRLRHERRDSAAGGHAVSGGADRDAHADSDPDSHAYAALQSAMENDPEKAKKYAELLYCQALLIADLPLEDPSAYTDLVCSLMD